MNMFRRFTTTVATTIENAVGQIENHEAVVQATIKQARQSVAKTKALANTLNSRQAQYEKRLDEITENVKQWETRAKSLAETNEEKALECLRRRNRAQEEQSAMKQRIAQHKKLVLEVKSNLANSESKLKEMEQKYSLMRSRQSVADINRAIASEGSSQVLGDAFERWESSVLEYEMDESEDYLKDDFADEFTQKEADESLQIDLQLLKQTHSAAQSVDETEGKKKGAKDE